MKRLTSIAKPYLGEILRLRTDMGGGTWRVVTVIGKNDEGFWIFDVDRIEE